jgi:hypothetical protein
MAKVSHVMHKEPIMGLHYVPCGKPYERLRPLPVVGFLLPISWNLPIETKEAYMQNKQIILLVGVIFLAFVGYKLISSNIQENKEKAVLLERARLEEAAKEPLNQCIAKAEERMNRKITSVQQATAETRTQEWKNNCEELQNSGWKADCRPSSSESLSIVIEEYKAEAEQEKEECYKQYK